MDAERWWRGILPDRLATSAYRVSAEGIYPLDNFIFFLSQPERSSPRTNRGIGLQRERSIDSGGRARGLGCIAIAWAGEW